MTADPNQFTRDAWEAHVEVWDSRIGHAGFVEQAFPPDHPQTTALGWGGKFSEIPPVLIARMRLK